MNKVIFRSCIFVISISFAVLSSQAQTPIEFETSDIVVVNDFFSGSAPFTEFAEVAANSDAPELLVTFVDVQSSETDPITGEVSQYAIWGVYVNSNTFEPIGEPFVIFGNPEGPIQNISSVYNPISHQYIVGAIAERGEISGDEFSQNTPKFAIVNTAESSQPHIAKAFEFDPDSVSAYNTIELAVDTKRGNVMLVSSYFFEYGGGFKESCAAFLFDQEMNLLSPLLPADIDAFNQTATGDVDNPHVNYLENRDLYYVVWNTEDQDRPSDELYRRVGGRVIEPEPDANGALVFGEAAVISNPDLANPDDDLRETHPDVIGNPFTGQFITVYSTGGNDQGGFISITDVGGPPRYAITKPRELDEPYVAMPDADTRVRQRQPEIAVDENSGVFMVAMTVRDGNGDYVTDALGLGGINIAFLGPDGNTLPPNSNQPSYVAGLPPAVYNATPDEIDTVDNQPHRYDMLYDESSDSFIIVYEGRETQFIKLARVRVTSDHRPADISTWMLF